MATFAAIVRSGSNRFWVLRFRRRKQSGFTSLFEPITFSADVHRRGVMQQAIEDRGRDDRVAEDRTPLAIAFVRSQDDAASCITGADQLEENSCTQLIQRQIPHLIDDQHLRSQVNSQPAVQAALSIRASEIGDQVVRRRSGREAGFASSGHFAHFAGNAQLTGRHSNLR